MPTQSPIAQPLLRPFLAALILSTLCLGLVFLMASPTHADSSADNFPSFTIQRPFGDQQSLTQTVVVTDTNGDGHNDIITGDDGGQNVVYLGSATGNFAQQIQLGTGADATRGIVAANIKGHADKQLDLVVGNYRQRSLVYINQSAGSASPSYASGPVDCNQKTKVLCFGDPTDATLSVAVVYRVASSAVVATIIAINQTDTGLQVKHYTKNQSDDFQVSSYALAVDGEVTSVALANVDGNNNEDVLVGVATESNGQNIGKIVAYTDKADGSYASSTTLASLVDARFSNLAIGNLDAGGPDDHGDDIVAINSKGASQVYLRTASAFDKTGFSAEDLGTASDSLRSLTLGNVDGVNGLDIVAGGSHELIIYQNNGAGQFPIARRLPKSGAVYAIAVADVVEPEYPDIVAVGSGDKVIFRNDHVSRTFGTDADNVVDIAVADNKELIVAKNGGQNRIYTKTVDADFAEGPVFGSVLTKEQQVAASDVDGDGDKDIVVGVKGKQGLVYLRQSNGTFYTGTNDFDCSADPNPPDPPTTTLHPFVRCFGGGTVQTSSIAVANMGGTPDPDIVAGIDGGQSKIYFNDGTGAFTKTPALAFGAPNTATVSIAAAQMDGLSGIDIVAGVNGGQSAVYLQKADKTFYVTDTATIDCNDPFVRCFGGSIDKISRIAVADMDGNGAPDIVVARNGAPSLIYLNQGGGHFDNSVPNCDQLRATLSIRCFGATPKTTSLALADVNRDGLLDIVTGNDGQPNIVYFNRGGGAFFNQRFDCQSQPLSVRCFGAGSDNTTSVGVIDLGADQLGLVVGNNGQPGMVDVQSGWISQSFGSSAGYPSSIVTGDLNNDGRLDLVVGNVGGLNTVYLNTGGGNTGPPRTFGTDSNNTTSVALADINGDRYLDVIAGSSSGSSMVYLNDRAGAFPVSPTFNRTFGGPNEIVKVAVADIDGKDGPDIVASSAGQSAVYLRQPNGTFYSTSGPVNCFDPRVRCFGGPNGSDITSLSVANIDNDTDVDIIVGRTSYNGYQSAVYLNVGTSFDNNSPSCASPRLRCFGTALSIAVADINRDGSFDIVAGAAYSQSLVYLNDPTGTSPFSSTLKFGAATDWTQSVAVADMNGDGQLDIIAGNAGQSRVYLQSSQTSQTSQTPQITYPSNSLSTSNCTPPSVRCFGTEDENTFVVLAADMDGAKGLDIVALNVSGQGRIFLNNGKGLFPPTQPIESAIYHTESVVVADLDRDNDLDLVAGNAGLQNRIYLNNGQGVFPISYTLGAEQGATSVAVGDLDGRNGLDIIVGSKGQGHFYLNNGNGSFAAGSAFGDPYRGTQSVALGDVDRDEDLDIVAASGGSGLIFLNTSPVSSTGSFYSGRVNCASPPPSVRCFGVSSGQIGSVALSDIDNNGAPDIIVGAYKGQSLVYLNDGAGNFASEDTVICASAERVRCFGGASDNTTSVAAADMNGDDFVDIVVGNQSQQSVVYLNDRNGGFSTSQVDCSDSLGLARCFGDGSDKTESVAVGDMDGDGALDIVTGNDGSRSWVYLNDGKARFTATRAFGKFSSLNPDATSSVAVGDFNRDGALDIVAGSDNTPSTITLGASNRPAQLPNNPPSVLARLPDDLPDANFLAVPKTIKAPLNDPVIDIPYALFDPEGDPVREISVTYSLDGGGRWFPAKSADVSTTLDIVQTNCSGQPCQRSFPWKVYDSGFFGQSDSVVVRFVAYPAASTGRNSVPGVYQYPYAATQTFPFRVRGTQVRIITATQDLPKIYLPIAAGLAHPPAQAPCISAARPCYRQWLPFARSEGVPQEVLPIKSLAKARIYLLREGRDRGAEALSQSGQPLLTDAAGYLQGRAQVKAGDRLVALLPITSTSDFDLYYTSAAATSNGLLMYTANGQGEQRLLVSSDNPLALFKLKVSVEWDASADPDFQNQLRTDIRRASELLYQWSGGQAALGKVTIKQHKEDWDTANVRIYASNRVRPNAVQGGIVDNLTRDPYVSKITYTHGQVRIGPVWSRYGDRSGNQGEDWPRALAHELGHYLFYLDDNYLGLQRDVLVPIPRDPTKAQPCPGPMTDPYRLDYTQFATRSIWKGNPTCGETLAAQTSGRWDWFTITTFYPWLDGSRAAPGPRFLPLNLTQFDPPAVTSSPGSTPIFSLVKEDGTRIFPSLYARAFLFRAYSATAQRYTQIVDLGVPTLDQVQARGAQPSDRLCVYDLNYMQGEGRQAVRVPRLGCKAVSSTSDQLALSARPDWAPDIAITPVTSSTIEVRVGGVKPIQTVNQTLVVEFYPADTTTGGERKVVPASGGEYRVRFSAKPEDVRAGYVRVQAKPGYEIIADYALGGGPARITAGGGGGGAGRQVREAPAVSSDGQVLLYANTNPFTPDQVINLYAATKIPTPPVWATLVGQSYWLTATHIPDLKTGLSISFNYLGREVPDGEEQGLTVYFWDGHNWSPIEETVRDANYNVAAAPSHGPGLYALMSSIDKNLDAGWQDFPYPIRETRPVTEALASIEGCYKYVFKTGTSLHYEVGVPDDQNTLKNLEYGGYNIFMTKPCKLRLKGPIGTPDLTGSHIPMHPTPATYYGRVESGAGFKPATGMAIHAFIDGIDCGSGRTFASNGQILYAVFVGADTPRLPGCGRRGRIVSFRVGPQAMSSQVAWESDRPREISLRP